MRETVRQSDQTNPKEMCLKEICFHAVRKHFTALGIKAVLDLPAPLIKDLLPRLTVCQLDELQPELNQRGISTLSGWAGVLRDMCGPNHAVAFHTEEEAKHEVMRMLFTLVFYGFTNPFLKRNITNLNTPSFLFAATKCIRHFLLFTSLYKPLQRLTAEQRPLLNLLEKRIRSVGVSQSIDLSKKETQIALYILHRLLDHGVAKEIVVHVQCPIVLAWLLHGRGSQYVNPELKNFMHSSKESCVSQAASASAERASCSSGLETSASEDKDDQVTPCKRSKLISVTVEEESGKVNCTVDPQVLCQTFTPHGPSAATFRDSDVLSLAGALKQLSVSSRSCLTHLNIGILPYTRLMEILLDASPKVTALHVEIQTVMCGPPFSPYHPRTAESDMSELPLEKLTVKVAELQTDLHFMTSVMRRSPQLTSLHIAGIRLPTGSSLSQLLTTLSESNHCLRTLNLEDMKLSDCLPEILNLLRNCKLEELTCNDCRLLEKCSDKEESLQQLVSVLKTVPSLHTLSLAQNRLAKNVFVLAELFSGSSISSVKRLDISSNFIQPAELLEFAERLRTHRPPHLLTLDLRKNPGDRDPDTWNVALKKLRPFCVLLVEGWKSTDTMVDHISNM